MKCERIREKLLTEYIDGRASETVKLDVERHLNKCGACLEYYRVLREKVVSPLQKAEPMEAPKEVWDGVRDRIIQRELDKRKVPAFFGLRKPAMALASVLVLIALVFGGARYMQYEERKALNDYLEGEASFLLALGEGTDVDNGNGFGTSIEEYFL